MADPVVGRQQVGSRPGPYRIATGRTISPAISSGQIYDQIFARASDARYDFGIERHVHRRQFGDGIMNMQVV